MASYEEHRRPRRIVVGISAATGAVYGVRVLEKLAEAGVESHLIISTWARRTIEHETGATVASVERLASVVHRPGDQASVLSSGSFRTDGMIVAPCSVRSVASIAHGVADNLLLRAADVTIKERKPLVLMVRETPLSVIHLENLTLLARAGVTIFPPVPAFYGQPGSIRDIVDHTVSRALDQLGVEDDQAHRWDGRLDRPARVDEPAASLWPPKTVG
ncbi:UbiX family flavin prenyltransferase [Nocardioides humi]|uniref:Flavin prenyltransferase UbiX n=1 Tax=Nocardioides humi TaxID=449461 RepID=A0ABN2A7W9_9ACTN|nr:UbiX family flavin prenyltransferase [Nocardioides humi]